MAPRALPRTARRRLLQGLGATAIIAAWLAAAAIAFLAVRLAR